MPSGDDFQPAMFGLSRIQSTKYFFGTRRGKKGSPREGIVDALFAGSVCKERLPIPIKLQPPGIHKSLGIHIQLERMRVKLPDAAALKPPDSPGSLHMTMNVNRLVEIHPAFGPPPEGVDKVVRIGRAKPT